MRWPCLFLPMLVLQVTGGNGSTEDKVETKKNPEVQVTGQNKSKEVPVIELFGDGNINPEDPIDGVIEINETKYDTENRNGSKIGLFSFTLSDGRSRRVRFHKDDQELLRQTEDQNNEFDPLFPRTQFNSTGGGISQENFDKSQSNEPEIPWERSGTNSSNVSDSRTPISRGKNETDRETFSQEDQFSKRLGNTSEIFRDKTNFVIEVQNEVIETVEPEDLELDKKIQKVVKLEIERTLEEKGILSGREIEEKIDEVVSNYASEILTKIISDEVKKSLLFYGLLDVQNSTKSTVAKNTNETVDSSNEANKIQKLIDGIAKTNKSEEIAQRTGEIEEGIAKNIRNAIEENKEKHQSTEERAYAQTIDFNPQYNRRYQVSGGFYRYNQAEQNDHHLLTINTNPRATIIARRRRIFRNRHRH